MQIRKSGINRRIKEAAKAEFVNKGYQKASMRTIAEKSGVSVSNIYNYFQHKDEILKEILQPTLAIIDWAMELIEFGELHKDEHAWSLEYHLDQIPAISKFIDNNRESLTLLFFRSHGSSYENYKDELIDRYTGIIARNYKVYRAIRPQMNANVSDFFYHNLSSLYMNIMCEVLMHDVSYEDMLIYLKEMMMFAYGGGKALMKW